jgi:hypothetical protein
VFGFAPRRIKLYLAAKGVKAFKLLFGAQERKKLYARVFAVQIAIEVKNACFRFNRAVFVHGGARPDIRNGRARQVFPRKREKRGVHAPCRNYNIFPNIQICRREAVPASYMPPGAYFPIQCMRMTKKEFRPFHVPAPDKLAYIGRAYGYAVNGYLLNYVALDAKLKTGRAEVCGASIALVAEAEVAAHDDMRRFELIKKHLPDKNIPRHAHKRFVKGQNDYFLYAVQPPHKLRAPGNIAQKRRKAAGYNLLGMGVEGHRARASPACFCGGGYVFKKRPVTPMNAVKESKRYMPVHCIHLRKLI